MLTRARWTVGILVLSVLLAGGLWLWMTVVVGDKQPRFQSISVDPPELRFVGGRVTVRARVTDDGGVLQVGGLVSKGGVQWMQLPVKTLPNGPRQFTYQVGFQTPGNLRPGGAPADYSIQLVAVDSAGQETVGAASLRVWPPAAPPPPPE